MPAYGRNTRPAFLRPVGGSAQEPCGGSDSPCGHHPARAPFKSRASALGEVRNLKGEEAGKETHGPRVKRVLMVDVSCGQGQGSLPRRDISASLQPQGIQGRSVPGQGKSLSKHLRRKKPRKVLLVTALERKLFLLKLLESYYQKHTKNKSLVHNLATSKAVKIPLLSCSPVKLGGLVAEEACPSKSPKPCALIQHVPKASVFITLLKAC